MLVPQMRCLWRKPCIPGTAPTSAHLAAFLVFSGGESVRFGLSPRLVVPFELRTRLSRRGLVPISKSVPILHTFRRGDDFDLRWRFQTGDPPVRGRSRDRGFSRGLDPHPRSAVGSGSASWNFGTTSALAFALGGSGWESRCFSFRPGFGLGLCSQDGFLFYCTPPHSHSAVYPLEPDLLTASDEFSGHSGRHDGHATGLR